MNQHHLIIEEHYQLHINWRSLNRREYKLNPFQTEIEVEPDGTMGKYAEYADCPTLDHDID